MTTIKAFIRSHPLLSFDALAFAISWGGLIMVVGGPSEIPGTGGATRRCSLSWARRCSQAPP